MSQGGVGDPNTRASDADRERIVEQLRQHTADGRLTMDEFDQRMTAAYAAKTYGELAELTRDLPVDLGARSGKTPQDAPLWGASAQEPTTPMWGAWGGAGHTRPHPGPVGDIASAVIGAAMEWKLQRHAMREQMRAQMREQRRQVRLARRQARGPAGSFAGWLALSVLLTGIWFITGLAGGGWSDFWPAWPIGIVGLLMLARAITGFGGRR